MIVVSLSLLLVGILVTLYLSRWVLVAALIGLGIGVLLTPAVDFLHKKLSLPRSVSAGFVAVALLGIMVGTGFLIGNLFSDQIAPLMELVSKTLGQAGDALRKAEGVGKGNWFQKMLSRVDLADTVKRALGMATLGVKLSLTTVFGAVAVLGIAIYLAGEAARYHWLLLSFFPQYRREEVSRVAGLVAHSLRVWFGSQLVNMTIVGIISGIGLWLLGSPSWFALGVISGITDVIPYVGPVIAGFVALLVTLASAPDKFWWVLILYVAIHQVENHVVVPLVMRGAASLPPVPLLITMLVLGNLFGVLGALLAAPAVSVGRTLYLEVYVPRMDRWKHPALPSVFPPAVSENAIGNDNAA